MIGAIIGAGLSIASSVAGGIANRKAQKKQAAELRRQEQRQKAYYDRVMGEDATQRAEVQRLITMTQDEARRNNKRAEAMQAVMGGTDETVAAEKERGGKMMADTMSAIAANGQARKDAAAEQYLQAQAGIDQQKMQMQADKANNISSAIQGVMGAAGGIANAFSGGGSNAARVTQ